MGRYYQTKAEVVQACLELSRLGFIAGIGGNLAARVSDRLMVVTPSAADYLSMRPEDLCVLDLVSLEVVEGSKTPTTESGMHALLFRSRPDLRASVHTHQPVASAMAILNRSIPLLEEAELKALGDCVPVVAYAPSGTGMLVRALTRKISGNRNAYLLRNHGVICGAASMKQAIENVRLIEKAAARSLLGQIQNNAQGPANARLRELACASLVAPAVSSGKGKQMSTQLISKIKEQAAAKTPAQAISHWDDTSEILGRLKDLLKEPPRPLNRARMAEVLNYFETRCVRSKAIAKVACEYIPGGVQHNLAFNYPFPLAIDRAAGAYLRDVDGNKYIDFLQAGGPTLLGSNYAPVRKKIINLLNDCGPVTGLLHEYEYKLAAEIREHMPGIEMFRMLGSGSEGVMAAIRLARAWTGKKKVIKIGGSYHGWSDSMVYGMRIPGTGRREATGIPRGATANTQECFPNDPGALRRTLWLNRLRGGTAAVIVEPLGPESGTRPVYFDYNKEVRQLCDEFGALLIFDEVVSGFRAGMGGAQGFFNVRPDLTVFGKCLTGGYPMAGGIGGRKEIMLLLAGGLSATGKRAFVGGTLSANPLSCAAGYFSIQEYARTGAPRRAGQAGDRLAAGLKEIVDRLGLPYVVYNQGSIVHVQTSGVLLMSMRNPIKVLREVKSRKHMMEEMGAAFMANGIVTLAGSRIYTSMADTDEIIDEALNRFENVLRMV